MDCEWDDQFSAISLADCAASASLMDDRENYRPEDPMMRNLMHSHELEFNAAVNNFHGIHKRKFGVPSSPVKSELHTFPPPPPHMTKKLRLVTVGSNFTSTCKLNSRNLASF